MTKQTYGHTQTGKPIDDDLIEQLADQAVAGYEVDEILARRGERGRPRLGSAPSTVEFVSTPTSRHSSLAVPKGTVSRSQK